MTLYSLMGITDCSESFSTGVVRSFLHSSGMVLWFKLLTFSNFCWVHDRSCSLFLWPLRWLLASFLPEAVDDSISFFSASTAALVLRWSRSQVSEVWQLHWRCIAPSVVYHLLPEQVCIYSWLRRRTRRSFRVQNDYHYYKYCGL